MRRALAKSHRLPVQRFHSSAQPGGAGCSQHAGCVALDCDALDQLLPLPARLGGRVACCLRSDESCHMLLLLTLEQLARGAKTCTPAAAAVGLVLFVGISVLLSEKTSCSCASALFQELNLIEQPPL